MQLRAFCAVTLSALICQVAVAGGPKTYKHAAEYQVAILDQTIQIATGTDATLARSQVDAKLSGGTQGVHLLHTDAGDFRVEAPVNTGATILGALGRPAYAPAVTVHNKWFLDRVQGNTQVLFASKCGGPNRKHPDQAVRCVFWFPDPDSDSHEYQTIGDFTPNLKGDGANTMRVANTLCGTGKLNAATEAQLCGGPAAATPPPPAAMAASAAPVAVAIPSPAAAAPTGEKSPQ